MNAALLSLTLLGSSPVMPVSDRVPELHVEALCKATVADDKAMGLSEPQSYADCERDEMNAKQQLTTIWKDIPTALRDRCEGEAVAGGSESYVDFLTCIQMEDVASSSASPPQLRGASKHRNQK